MKTELILENIEIIDIADDGKAIARYDNKVVFVDHAVPGDICNIRIYKKKKSFFEGKVIQFNVLSEKRNTPFCKHFGLCGGCKWQDMKYEQQLAYKSKHVLDCLTRIAKLDNPQLLPIEFSEKTIQYRNKLEYTFSNRRWLTSAEMNLEQKITDGLGFHIPGMFDKVLDIESCYLQPEPSDTIRNEIKKFSLNNGFSYYDLRNHSGLLRNVIIRNNLAGEFMVIVVFYYFDDEKIKSLMTHIANSFPEIKSLLYAINGKPHDSLTSEIEVKTFKGDSFLYEKMDNLTFQIAPKSFFQTNSKQTVKLYHKVLEFASLTGNEIVYDLYTGTGTIANFVAPHCEKVIGIEYVEDAVKDARINSEINKIKNTIFYSGDMRQILTKDFINIHGVPDVIITDPPRAGMHKDVVQTIMDSDAEKIVYVSCNPSTQARDIELLSVKYNFEKSQPFDMFPHTHHVENIVLLRRK